MGRNETLCKFFYRGTCNRGTECEWSHDESLLASVSESTRKTRMCRYNKTGTCRNGDDCNFAHSRDELRRICKRWNPTESVQMGCFGDHLFVDCPAQQPTDVTTQTAEITTEQEQELDRETALLDERLV